MSIKINKTKNFVDLSKTKKSLSLLISFTIITFETIFKSILLYYKKSPTFLIYIVGISTVVTTLISIMGDIIWESKYYKDISKIWTGLDIVWVTISILLMIFNIYLLHKINTKKNKVQNILKKKHFFVLSIIFLICDFINNILKSIAVRKTFKFTGGMI